MEYINHKSDFKIFERNLNGDTTTPFKFTYFTYKGELVASFDGKTYDNCKMQPDGTLVIVFDNHGLSFGELMVTREYFLTDTDFKDGVCKLVSTEHTGIMLTSGKTSISSAEITLPPFYQKGDKGDPFVYDDFTPEQLSNLKGEKGDSFKYEDFTSNQLAELKGEAGEPMTWEKMTQEQKESLKNDIKQSVEHDLLTTSDINDITDIIN